MQKHASFKWSRGLMSAACLSLMLGAAGAQSMKTTKSGAGHWGLGAGPGPCELEVPGSSGISRPETLARKLGPSGGRVALGQRIPRPRIVFDALVWWSSYPFPPSGPKPSIRFTIKLGIENTTGAAWTVPTTFVVTDRRTHFNSAESYADDSKVLEGWPYTFTEAHTALQFPEINFVPGVVSAVSPSTTVMMPSSLSATVEWQKRPAVVITAKDAQGNTLGICPIDGEHWKHRALATASTMGPRSIVDPKAILVPRGEAASVPTRQAPDWNGLKTPR